MVRASLKLKAEKCALLKRKISFLGHVIDKNGVHTDPEKVQAIRDYPTPKDVKELRTFLGMVSYYRKFCLGFSKKAACLFSLTSAKSTWQWGKEQQEAIDQMKQMISSAPVLAQPNIEKARDGTRPFIIYADASAKCLGAVLSQEGNDISCIPSSLLQRV